MEEEKTVSLSFRVTPRMKRMLEAAATHERRSLTNMLEVLVETYCRNAGLPEAAAEHDVSGRPAGGTTK